MIVLTILTLVPLPQPSFSAAVAIARTAVMASEISQPSVAIQLSAAGILAPRTPKVARVNTIVGAFPRLPAIDITPTSRKDTITPIMVISVACQKDIAKPSAQAPYDMANTEIFAANHGQNRLAGVPLRSLSLIVSMPCSSMLKELWVC